MFRSWVHTKRGGYTSNSDLTASNAKSFNIPRAYIRDPHNHAQLLDMLLLHKINLTVPEIGCGKPAFSVKAPN